MDTCASDCCNSAGMLHMCIACCYLPANQQACAVMLAIAIKPRQKHAYETANMPCRLQNAQVSTYHGCYNNHRPPLLQILSLQACGCLCEMQALPQVLHCDICFPAEYCQSEMHVPTSNGCAAVINQRTVELSDPFKSFMQAQTYEGLARVMPTYQAALLPLTQEAATLCALQKHIRSLNHVCFHPVGRQTQPFTPKSQEESTQCHTCMLLQLLQLRMFGTQGHTRNPSDVPLCSSDSLTGSCKPAML
jgi:hypothetical protein